MLEERHKDICKNVTAIELMDFTTYRRSYDQNRSYKNVATYKKSYNQSNNGGKKNNNQDQRTFHQIML